MNVASFYFQFLFLTCPSTDLEELSEFQSQFSKNVHTNMSTTNSVGPIDTGPAAAAEGCAGLCLDVGISSRVCSYYFIIVTSISVPFPLFCGHFKDKILLSKVCHLAFEIFWL